jgi:CubicO group peptidase (beta-lactamase class C family)
MKAAAYVALLLSLPALLQLDDAHAQLLPRNTIAAHGVVSWLDSPRRSEPRRCSVASIDSLITAFMTANGVPGLAACIVKNGQIAWDGYYGFADVPRQVPVGPATIFMLASVSKTITGTALMQLWERRIFKIDDSVTAYLPFVVRNPNHPLVPITFRHLMTHVSSLRDTWSKMPYFFGDAPDSLGWYLHEYLTPGGQYYASSNYSTLAPATYYAYCNIAVALCGFLVEVITGVPFDQYCRDSIFVPLGMTNTAWYLRDLDTTLVARPYTFVAGSLVDQGLYGYYDYPDGALRTTATSLGRFLLAHLGFGVWNGVRILDSSAVRFIRSVHYPALSQSQGLIWRRYLIGQRAVWGHEGSDPGVRTMMGLDEQHRTGAVILANLSGIDLGSLFASLMDVADSLTVGIAEQNLYAVARGYSLEQNHPNPFNPRTVISCQWPIVSDVRLVVYDILGREVAVLVNEKKMPGKYNVEFNASSLASGVYFYRLVAGQYVETRKMVLVR